MTLESAAPPATSEIHLLQRGGVALALHVPGRGLPSVVHWGAPLHPETGDLAELVPATRRGVGPSGFDAPWDVSILPTEADGWEGRPAIAGHRARRPLLPHWRAQRTVSTETEIAVDAEAEGLALRSRFTLDADGVLRVSHELTNTGAEPLELSALEAVLPVGDTAREALDFSGRWVRERTPQRGPLLEGSRERHSRRGRTGHDAPFVSVVGSPGFSNDAGEVWAVHLAWSGNAVYRTDALSEAGTHLGAGASLAPGEVVLAPGERHLTPDAVFVWSDEGLDGLSDRLHRSIRARPEHPRTPRPVTLNTWEAVYFTHGLGALTELAHVAADLGVERFVLDDGWFRGRRSDRSGLGDWTVDPVVWPDGLHPLASVVRGLGMEFGLWVEPEMVNLDSDLARAHPEWLLQSPEDGALSWRHQYVLNLARADVRDHLLESLSRLVEDYGLAYLKWDQNRDVVDAAAAGRPTLTAHTAGVYELMAALRSRHPGLEIESCASGGARIDLGVLAHTDRVWPSDTNDPIERLAIQRWTELLLPPELIGAHIGPPRAHTTGRITDLSLRIATALVGSLGIEWDITTCSPTERDELRDGIAAYRRLRGMLHAARLAHLDVGDDGLDVTAAVAGDRAVVRVARIASGPRSLPVRLRVPGLDANTRYRVRPVEELRFPRTSDMRLPQWLDEGSCTLSGAALAAVGVRLPMLRPQQALVVEIDPAS